MDVALFAALAIAIIVLARRQHRLDQHSSILHRRIQRVERLLDLIGGPRA
jgi:hypothetical protein